MNVVDGLGPLSYRAHIAVDGVAHPRSEFRVFVRHVERDADDFACEQLSWRTWRLPVVELPAVRSRATKTKAGIMAGHQSIPSCLSPPGVTSATGHRWDSCW